jgi:hypothetical protein
MLVKISPVRVSVTDWPWLGWSLLDFMLLAPFPGSKYLHLEAREEDHCMVEVPVYKERVTPDAQDFHGQDTLATLFHIFSGRYGQARIITFFYYFLSFN